jgi:ParB family chromosome partitioning protein
VMRRVLYCCQPGCDGIMVAENENSDEEGEMTEDRFMDLDVKKIVPSRWQPRSYPYDGDGFEELKASVRRHGVLNRLRVFINEDGKYEVITGHRRWLAASGVGLAAVPVEIVEYPGEEDQVLRTIHEEVIVDNLYHEDLTPIEEARAIEGLMEDEGYNQGEVGHILGKSQQWVSDRLSLLKLAPAVQTAVTARAVDFSVARKLATLPEEVQAPVMESVKEETSREAEKAANKISKALEPGFWALPEGPRDYEDLNAHRLLHAWRVQVQIAVGQGKMLAALERKGLLRPAHRLEEWELTNRVKGVLEDLIEEPLPSWDKFAESHSLTCENCLWQEARPFWMCEMEDRSTCLNYLGPEDPVMLRVPDENQDDCDRCLDERGWCGDEKCHVEHLEQMKREKEARLNAQEREREESRRAGRRVKITAFYERQAQDDVDPDHWLAQACVRCVSFRGDDHPGGPCGAEGGYHAVHFWTNDDGKVIPRCSSYKVSDLRFIPEMSQSSAKEILIAQLKACRQNQPNRLGWLPCEDGVKALSKWLHEEDLTVKQLVAMVTMALNENIMPFWGPDQEKGFKQVNPVTGEYEKWKKAAEGDAGDTATG